MVVQIAFFNSPQNFSTRECAHRNNDTQKICIFIQRPLISIHCNNKNRQILCKLEYGRPFSVFVNLYRKKNKFYFYSTSKNILIPVQSNHPDIIQYSELGTRSFFRGSLSAPHSIFSPGSLTLMRSFFEFPFSLVAQTLVAQPVVR